jgi:pyruvate kinase
MLGIGVDWVALSFVQRPSDIQEIIELIDEKLPPGQFKPCIMAKIEKPSCFDGDNLEQIIELCNGIMVARGDLGVEWYVWFIFVHSISASLSCVYSLHLIHLFHCKNKTNQYTHSPPEDVPLLQKQIINECRRQGTPVVVATQMLESMIDSPTPTRAEASDVATAIYDGADAIMLSAESAAGKYPEESVAMQQRIINRVESDGHYRNLLEQNAPLPGNTPTDAMIVAARQICQTINAKAIVCFSLRGTTVLRASKKRPSVPILALCPFKETARQLALSWGVYPDLPKAGSYGYSVSEDDMFNDGRTFHLLHSFVEICARNNRSYQILFSFLITAMIERDTDDFDLVLRNACRAALKKGLVNDPNDLLVVTAGLPFGTPGAANVLRIVPAAGPSCWDGVCRVD